MEETCEIDVKGRISSDGRDTTNLEVGRVSDMN